MDRTRKGVAMNAEAIRPGSVFKAWGETWKVLSNDTLNRILVLEARSGSPAQKRIRYHPGQEINLRWSPSARI